MTKQEEILHLLVKKLGGHSVTIIREGVGELAGFSVGKGRSIAIDDLIAVVFEPAPSPQTHTTGSDEIRSLAVKAFNEAIDADGYETSYEIIEKAIRAALASKEPAK